MDRVDWEVGVDKVYITLYIEWMAIEWMANEGLLYSSGRSTPCSIVNLNRKEMKEKGGLYVCVRLIYFAIWQKSESCAVVSNSLGPHGLYSSWNSPDQNTRVETHGFFFS